MGINPNSPFFKFWSKSLQPKSDECLCWLSQRINWEFFPLWSQRQKCLSMFLTYFQEIVSSEVFEWEDNGT